MKWFVFLIFGCGGLAILVSGGVLTGQRYLMLQHGVHAQGTITEVTEPDYSVFIEFATKTGERIKFKALQKTKSEPEPDWRLGAKIDVVYDPAEPYEARATTFDEFWITPVAFMIVGVIMAAMGFGISRSMGAMDRDFDRMKVEMRSDSLIMDPKAIKIAGTVQEVRAAADEDAGSVIVCTGRMFDGALRLFPSQPRKVDGALDLRGRAVDIYLDPFNKDIFLVDIDPVIHQAKKERERGIA